MKILIVEDMIENIDVAKEALGGEHKLTFATNYANASKALAEGDFDACLTDLFFPENEGEAIGETGSDLLALLQEVQEERKADLASRGMWDRYETDFVDENAPMGLKVFAQAVRQGVPCLIISNGDRHHGSLGFVRNTVGRLLDVADPMPQVLYDMGSCDNCTKSYTQTWQNAVQQLTEDRRKEQIKAGKALAKAF